MSDLKSELQLQSTLAAAPAMTRAQSNHISADPATAKLFAYGSANTVIVRNVEDPAQVLLSHRHSSAVTVARIAPNGLLVASGDKDGNISIWANRSDTAEKYRSKLLNGAVRDISWSDDSERVAIVGEGRGDFATVITVSGSSLGEITGHVQNIVTCDFRKTRPFKLFTGGADTKVCFYEGPPFKFAHSVASTFKATVTCVRVSPDGELVACVSGSADILILDAKTGKDVKTIPTGHQGTIYSIAWSPDSKRFTTASADKTVKTFLVESGEAVASVVLGKSIPFMQQSVFYSAAGVVSASLNGTLQFLGDGSAVQKQWYGHQKPLVGLFFDAQSNALVSFATDGVVLKWPAAAPGSAEPITVESDVINCAAPVGTTGTYVAVAGTDLVIVNPSTTGPATVLCKEANHALGVAALNNGTFVLLYRNAFSVFSAQGKKLHEEKIAQFDGSSIAVHGDIIALGGDKVVRLYKVEATGKPDLIGTFQGRHTVPVTAVAFSPDGQSVASGDSGKTIFVWSVADPSKVLYENLTFHTLRVTSLAFQGPSTLVSGSVDASVIVWDLDGKRRRVQDYAHRGGVSVVALGAPGDLFTAGGDLCIRRWAA
ncbi:actin-interacting protein 1, putative [Bodo saltans]|uniref:Actin-interacting protein 1, putative n=1 Tax=Bodo saltans TaxID=75058 RepID=A0A0S4JPK4_BODSA|nr:actin-interacting protein 1, putative [Bodo saltans]|eukprot:CUG93474.1 actin-interacting protein 1, putative [Bodo saltans]